MEIFDQFLWFERHLKKGWNVSHYGKTTLDEQLTVRFETTPEDDVGALWTSFSQ